MSSQPAAVLLQAGSFSWVGGLLGDGPAVIAIDAKTSRRSHDRRKGGKPLYRVSAFADRQQIVPVQRATEEKSNEIIAIPLLLKQLALTGALVIIAAMETQTDMPSSDYSNRFAVGNLPSLAQAIRDEGGDYFMWLKKRWTAVSVKIDEMFDNPPKDVASEEATPVDQTCGRIETEVERGRKVEHEIRYYPCSLVLRTLTFALAVRAHWGDRERPARGVGRGP